MWCVRAMLVYWNVFSPSLVAVAVDAVRVFILETHVRHYELKSQMFIIIISTRESDQISFAFLLPLARVSSILFPFYLPFATHPFSSPFTSN